MKKVFSIFMCVCIILSLPVIVVSAKDKETFYESIWINGIKYNLKSGYNSNKKCNFAYASAVYTKVKGSILKYPDYVSYKNKKYKVKYVNILCEEEYHNKTKKFNYKNIILPKYCKTFNFECAKFPKLKKIYVSKYLEQYNWLDFEDMPNLKVSIDKNNKYIKFKNGAIYSRDGERLIALINSKKIYNVSKYTLEVSINSKILRKISIPNSVSCEKIYLGGCKNLSTINIGNKGTEFKSSAFANCRSLKSIILPKTLKVINKFSFLNCNELKKVVLNSTSFAPKIDNDAFKNTKKGIEFYCKNKKVADQLFVNLKNSGVNNAKIYYQMLVYENVK